VTADQRAIHVKWLASGYYLVRGTGPCEWVQVPAWPCEEATLREHAFPEASESFIREALRAMRGLESEDAGRV